MVQRMREGNLGEAPGETVFGKVEGAEERRRDCQGMHRGTHIVNEAGQGEFSRTHAAADGTRGLQGRAP